LIGVVSGGDRQRLVSLAAFAGAVYSAPARDVPPTLRRPRGVAMPAASGRISRALRRVGSPRTSAAAKVIPARKSAPAKKAAPPKKAAPAKKAVVKKTPAKKAVVKKAAPAKKAVVKKAPAKKAPAKKAAVKKAAPAKKAAVKKAPARNAVVKKAPATKAVVKKAPARKAVVKKAPPAKKAAATNAPPKKVAATAPAPVRPPLAKKAAPRIAVPRGSDWTPAELAEIRTQLVAELGAMQGEYDRSMRDLNDLQQANSDGAGDDQADAGSKTFEREQELSIAANRLDLLAQIQRAVERIDAGTYGYCESCGKPIPKARLKAFPMATLDVACKQREERR
jgi:RNA polymerase-binding protein DksA